MPTATTPPPALRSRNNLALVTLSDARTKRRRDYYLGAADTPESRERYHRLIARWEAQGRTLPDPEGLADGGRDGPGAAAAVAASRITIDGVVHPYRQWAEGYYTASEYNTICMALRVLRRLYGSTPAAEFGPKALRVVRDAMVRGEPAADPPRVPWARTHVNKQVHRLCAMFKWAAGQELLPVSVYQQLKTVEPLRRGRCAARESDPVLPVPAHLIDGLEGHVSAQVWAIIQLQRLTGARCGELFRLRPADLDASLGEVWTWSPGDHKTAHHGKQRTIYFGPRAQAMVRPFLEGRPADRYLFSPAEAEADRLARLHALRKTPLHHGNRPGTNVVNLPARMPGDRYTTDSYRRAIARACQRAFPPPEPLRRGRVKSPNGPKQSRWETPAEWQARLGPERWAELLRWQREHGWHPHRLRHTAGTNIRRQFGLEAAQLALGHSSALVTEAIYAERDMEKVVEMMKQIG